MKKKFWKISLFAAVAVFFMLASPLEGKEFEDLEISETLSADKTELVLSGVGMRTKYNIIDVYAGALYLPEGFGSTSSELKAEDVMVSNDPMAIRMHIVTGLASKQKLDTALKAGFESSTDGNIKPLKNKIEEFISAFKTEEINKSDIFDIFYLPKEGVQIYKNSKKITTIKSGMKFKKAVFGIWLSDEPAQESLKKAMLGY